MNFSAIAAARELLAKYLPRTRTGFLRNRYENFPEQNVCLKLESELPTGSFKVRGAIYALASMREGGGRRGVVASSTESRSGSKATRHNCWDVAPGFFFPKTIRVARQHCAVRCGIMEKGAVDLAGA
jgi:hypothetical protein